MFADRMLYDYIVEVSHRFGYCCDSAIILSSVQGKVEI